MSAILGRIIFREGMPVCEYLRRDTALFADAEWSWTPERDEAHVFADNMAAEAAAKTHTWRDDAGVEHRPWPLVVSLARGRREASVAGAEASVREMPRGGRNFSGGATVTATGNTGASLAATPAARARETRGSHKESAAGKNSRVRAKHMGIGAEPPVPPSGRKQPEPLTGQRQPAPFRRQRTAADFKAVLEKMEREHPHEEVFAETERRLGEHA